MVSDRMLRTALRISVPFNFLAAYAVALPASFMGQMMGLSPDVNLLNASLLSFLIALFGVAYVWMSMQEKIDRPLVFFSACGKSGVFIIVTCLWVAGESAALTVLFTTGDLLFAILFFGWLTTTSGRSA